jgi:hypothetical protein
VDFFRHLPVFLADADRGSDLTRRYGCNPGDKVQLTKLQKQLTYTFVLSEKYRRTFKVFLRLCPAATASCDPGDDALARVGWHLFCLAKQTWLGTFCDLSALAHLLVAVLAVLIAHAPPERLVSPFDNITQFPQRAPPAAGQSPPQPPGRGGASRGSGDAAAAMMAPPADVVGSLCAQSKAQREPVQLYVDRLAQLVADVLPHRPPLVEWEASRSSGRGGADTCLPVGPSRLPGLIPADGVHMAAVADALGAAYEELMRQHKAEVDERDFLGSRLDTARDVAGGQRLRFGAGLTGNPALLTPRQSGRFDRPQDGPQPQQRAAGANVLPPLHFVALGDAVPPTGLVPPGAGAGTPFRGMASPAAMGSGGGGGGAGHGVVAVSSWLRNVTSMAPGELWTVTDNVLTMEPPSPTLARILAAAHGAQQGGVGGASAPPPMPPAALFTAIQKKANSFAAALFPILPADGVPVGSQATAAPVGEARGNAALDSGSLRQHLCVLFMRMLDRVLLREEKRQAARAGPGSGDDGAPAAALDPAQPTPDLSALLQSDAFLRALACACAELLLRATELHNQPQFAFPASCAAVHCSPIEVCPLLVSVIEADPHVPRELRRHLNTLAEQVLEQGGWERGSRLYDYLSAMQRRASLAVTDAAERAARFPHGSLPGAIGAVSDVQGGVDGDAAKLLSPEDQQQVAAAAGAEALVRGFVSQVMTLASLRLQKLADKLNFPDTLRSSAVAAFEFALHDCTQLFYGRHLDQTVLCVLYGAAKAAEWPRREEPLLFRDIIGAYRAVYRRDRGVPAPEGIYRRVAMAYRQPVMASLEADRFDDVIKFYNSVFVPYMKPFLLRTQPQTRGARELVLGTDTVAGASAAAAAGGGDGGEGTPGRQPRRSPFRVLPLSATPRRMGAFPTHSVMVSPLRGRDDGDGASGGGAVIAPRSGSLYAFLGESSQALQSPGRDLEYINARVAASGFAHTPSLLVDAAAAAAAAAAADAFTGAGLAGLGPRDMGPPSPIAEGDEEEAAAALMGASSQGDLTTIGDLPSTTPSSNRRRPAHPGPHGESPLPQRRRLLDGGEH